MAVLCFAGTAMAQTELLQNAGFEMWDGDKPVHWVPTTTAGNGTLSRSFDARTDSFSVMVKGASSNKRLAYEEMTLSPGSYTFSIYAKAATDEAAKACPGYAPLKEDGSMGAYVYGDYVDVPSTEWTLVSYTFTLEEETKLNLVVMNSQKPGKDLLLDDASLTFVEGSEGAPKARLAVVDGAVYFPLNGLLAGLKKIDPSGDQVSGVANMAFWMASPMINRFLGVAASDDGNLWVMGTSATDGGSEGTLSLGKLDLAANELTQNLLGTQPEEAYDCCFAAHGNTIYYANGTTLYRVLFDPEAGTDEFREEPLVDLASLDDNVGLLYNGLGVSPATGHVYANTLKGFGNAFTTNTIWEFDFDASLDTPVHRFDDHTRFPAGVYFCK